MEASYHTGMVYFTLAVIIAGFIAIYREYLRPSLGLLGIVIVFLVLRIIDPKIVLSGLSNPSIASIFLLILITAGLRKNFDTEKLVDILFGQTKNYTLFLFRMMASVGVLSSFVNNTPVVALLSPYVYNWGKENNISPSKLLIPLSFATIMGGTLTLIGTSTTLIMNGFLIQNGLSGFKASDLLVIGLFVFAFGIVFLGVFGRNLLPSRQDTLDSFKKNPKEYLLETVIGADSILIDKTVREAALRNLKGVYLVEVLRGEQSIAPVSPEFVLKPGDSLIFAGDTSQIVDLVNSNSGLSFPKQVNKINRGNVQALEAVMSNSSSLLGKKIKESDFRNRYNAAIVAVHRNGEKLSGKIGDISLKSGDLLLLFAGTEFQTRADLYRDVFVISRLKEWAILSKRKKLSLAAIGVLSLLLLFLGYFPLFTSLLIIFSVMAALRLITIQDLKRELDFDLLGTLIFSLVLGQILIETGTANYIANLTFNISQSFGPKAILIGLMICTVVLTNFISNVGAVSIMFPLTYSIVNDYSLHGEPYFLGVSFAASAAFISPLGYQTNLLIYGPGNYNYKDFIIVGIPTTIIYLISVLLGIEILYSP